MPEKNLEWTNEFIDVLLKSTRAEDHERAFGLCRSLAESGDSIAMVHLGRMYRDGKGTKKDIDKAKEWIGKAIEKDKKWVKELIDVLLRSEMAKDHERAFELCRPVAESGDNLSRVYLGRMYRDGKGTKKDIDKAKEWIGKAFEKDLYWVNEFVYTLLRSEMAKDHEMAFELCRPVAESGDDLAMIRLGRMYQDGTGTERNIDKAIEYMRAATEKKSAWGDELTDLLFARGTDEDLKEAFELFEKHKDIFSWARIGLLGMRCRDFVVSNKKFLSDEFNRVKVAAENKETYFTDVEFFDEHILVKLENDLSGKIEGANCNKCEMSYKERAFINGIIRKTKPKTIVELGVSAGGSACLILNAIRDMEGTKFYSFDYNTTWYKEIGQKNSRKTGFLVEEIVPELMHKWELYAGGVPCKYLEERLPKEGVDICLIDTAHSNPGEHLNILEILPFMKQNGIIIYHDTAYHCMDIRKAQCTTCCVSINTLNGRRILLRSEKTAGLPNIGAIILDKNIKNTLFALFSNISIPWNYKITEDDFLEMFVHFSKYYQRELVQIYYYYYIFYTSGGLNDVKSAKRIAEKQTKRVFRTS